MIQNKMTPEQFEELKAYVASVCTETVKENMSHAVSGYLDKHLDKHLDKGLDYGADGAQGLGGNVEAAASSLNSFTGNVPNAQSLGNGLGAALLNWQDLINQSITTSFSGATLTGAVTGISGATGNIVGSALTSATTTAFSAPSWLLTTGSGFQSLTPFQTYQLAVAYLGQNVAIFRTLNVLSSESGTSAPVLRGGSLTQVEISPWGAQKQDLLPLINATTPQDYQQNQIIARIDFAMSLFHYAQVTSGVNSSGSAVTLQFIFNATHKTSVMRGFAARTSKGVGAGSVTVRSLKP